MLMLLSSPLAVFFNTSTVPQPVQSRPAMLKLLDAAVSAVNEGLEQVIEVLVTACSCTGPVKSGRAPVRIRCRGSIKMVGLEAAAMRCARSFSFVMKYTAGGGGDGGDGGGLGAGVEAALVAKLEVMGC